MMHLCFQEEFFVENEIEVKRERRIFSRCVALKKSGSLFGPAKNQLQYIE